MKTLRLLASILLASISLSCNNPAPPVFHDSINPIVGDISFIEKYGIQPDLKTDEVRRIQTHLEYVENLLRGRDVSNLPGELRKNRTTMLDLLHEYWTAGVFPSNFDFPDKRMPCFIDRDGRICAVGYLIEQTAGRAVAEEINSLHKYEYLMAMNDRRIDDWVLTNGLTKEECAMIQPTYSGQSHVSGAYGVSSAVVSGLNISMMTVNGIQIAQGANRKTVGVMGLLTGAGQIVLGAFNYPEDKEDVWWDGNPDQRNVALMNIGIGTSTMILSTWNLITNRKPKEKPVSWNIYGFPTESRNVGIGFSLKKRL